MQICIDIKRFTLYNKCRKSRQYRKELTNTENFKYLSIAEWAEKYISDGNISAGERFFSEKELCDIHGVSRQTVRQALALLESRNVICRKRGSGTFVKSVAGSFHGSGFSVGVISTYFSDYIFPSIVTGIEKVLSKNNVGMQVSITHNLVSEESKALKAMLAQNVRGLIVEPSKSALPNPNMQLYDEIRRLKIPLIFFNAKYPWADFPCVAMDDIAAGRIVTDHLFKIGHRKISGIFSLDDMQGHDRYRGFAESCAQHGVMTAEQNALWFSTNEKNTLFTMSADRIKALLSGSTAIVCYNDSLAVNLLDFCRKQGISVPDDISVISIDDSKLSSLGDIKLTSARHPHQLLGEKAAEVLLEEIHTGNALSKDVIFTPELILRSSAKPLR